MKNYMKWGSGKGNRNEGCGPNFHVILVSISNTFIHMLMYLCQTTQWKKQCIALKPRESAPVVDPDFLTSLAGIIHLTGLMFTRHDTNLHLIFSFF